MLTDYHNYTELVSELESLAESYPHLSRIYSVGKSVQDRELLVIQISEGVTEVKIIWKIISSLLLFSRVNVFD